MKRKFNDEYGTMSEKELTWHLGQLRVFGSNPSLVVLQNSKYRKEPLQKKHIDILIKDINRDAEGMRMPEFLAKLVDTKSDIFEVDDFIDNIIDGCYKHYMHKLLPSLHKIQDKIDINKYVPVLVEKCESFKIINLTRELVQFDGFKTEQHSDLLRAKCYSWHKSEQNTLLKVSKESRRVKLKAQKRKPIPHSCSLA